MAAWDEVAPPTVCDRAVFRQQHSPRRLQAARLDRLAEGATTSLPAAARPSWMDLKISKRTPNRKARCGFRALSTYPRTSSLPIPTLLFRRGRLSRRKLAD